MPRRLARVAQAGLQADPRISEDAAALVPFAGRCRATIGTATDSARIVTETPDHDPFHLTGSFDAMSAARIRSISIR